MKMRARAVVWIVARSLGCSALASVGCFGESDAELHANVGTPCISDSENYATFSGFSSNEINVEESPACGDGNVCLVHEFQGRVSCAAGQSDATGGCLTPLGEPVEVAVPPQLDEPPPTEAAICSCRCSGPGRCACPSDMHCEPLIIGPTEFAGSYCVY